MFKKKNICGVNLSLQEASAVDLQWFSNFSESSTKTWKEILLGKVKYSKWSGLRGKHSDSLNFIVEKSQS